MSVSSFSKRKNGYKNIGNSSKSRSRFVLFTHNRYPNLAHVVRRHHIAVGISLDVHFVCGSVIRCGEELRAKLVPELLYSLGHGTCTLGNYPRSCRDSIHAEALGSHCIGSALHSDTVVEGLGVGVTVAVASTVDIGSVCCVFKQSCDSAVGVGSALEFGNRIKILLADDHMLLHLFKHCECVLFNDVIIHRITAFQNDLHLETGK